MRFPYRRNLKPGVKPIPNYKLNHSVYQTIKGKVSYLAQRTVDYACAEFPLTVATLQSCVLEDHIATDMRRLHNAHGIETIEAHTHVRLAFLKNTLPGMIKRGLVVSLWLPEGIFVKYATMYGMNTCGFDVDDSHYLVPELSRLDKPEQVTLARWIDRVVRAKRLHEITVYTANGLLNQTYMPTSAHMKHLWPALANLVEGKTHTQNIYSRKHNQFKTRQVVGWEDRMHQDTRNTKPYKPTAETLETWGKLIHAADTVLAAGGILEEYKHVSWQIRVNVEFVEKLPTDRVYE